jgi:hypothetical protein
MGLSRYIGCAQEEKGLDGWNSISSIWNRLGSRKAKVYSRELDDQLCLQHWLPNVHLLTSAAPK